MYQILIVEDEKIIRKGLTYGINYEEKGCIVVGEAKNGQEGMEKIKELQPDIVITDINMPIMDAFDMFEETLDYSYSTIIISGFDEFENAQKAIKYGVTEFIVKPIKKEDLYEAIDRAIEERKIWKVIQERKSNKEKLIGIDLLIPQEEVVSDRVVLEMINYVKQNYSKKFIFEDVAKEIGYSPTSLYNKFKKGTSLTFNDYLNRYRIQQAVHILINTDELVYEIAEKCGFNNYKYFNKVFNKYIGITPSEFKDSVSL